MVVGWVGGVSRLRNETALFNQCSMIYTACKMRSPAAHYVYISGLASGALPHTSTFY